MLVSLTGKLLYQGRTATRIKIFDALLADQSGKEIAGPNGISPSAGAQRIETGALEEPVLGTEASPVGTLGEASLPDRAFQRSKNSQLEPFSWESD